MEDIFEPRPSTSSEDIQLNAESTYMQSSALASKDAVERSKWREKADVGPRKLAILPRIAQYERHPLLQERSPSGLSQLEELTNMLQRQKSFDIAEDIDDADKNDSQSDFDNSPLKSCQVSKEATLNKKSNINISPIDFNNTKSNATHMHTSEHFVISDPNIQTQDDSNPNHQSNPAVKRLEPRGAFYERHPLLEKSESGLSELEIYLHEKEQELLLNSPTKDDCVKNNFRTINDYESMVQPCHKKLLPRVNQYEKHALLETRDAQGLSPIDHFLSEKERLILEKDCDRADIDQEEDSTGSKGKCSEKCVCKNATCTICKPNHSMSATSNNQTGELSNKQDNNSQQEMTEDIKIPLFHEENIQHEVIDLRDPAYIVDDDENNSDIVRSHPPLIKKESSRETVIEPKECNKRVHFERTLSDKEREMRAKCASGDVNAIQGKLILTHKNVTTRTDNRNQNNKKKFWSLWGKSSNQKKTCLAVSKNTSKDNQKEKATEQSQTNRDVRSGETQKLVTEECHNGEHKNENNMKSKKKACIIL